MKICTVREFPTIWYMVILSKSVKVITVIYARSHAHSCSAWMENGMASLYTNIGKTLGGIIISKV